MNMLEQNCGIHKILSSDYSEGTALSNVYEIEELLELISKSNQRVAFLKGYKKHKVDCIESEIKKHEMNIEKCENVILSTMKYHEPKQKTLSFPGVAKVTRKTNNPKLKIEDESMVLSFLDSKGLAESLVKKSLKVKETLDVLKSEYSNVKVPGTVLSDSTESLSVSFEKEDRKSTGKVMESKFKPSTDLDELDVLDI